MDYNVSEYMSAKPFTYYMTAIPSYVQACMVTYRVHRLDIMVVHLFRL